MTTITLTAPELKTITRSLSSDWGPTLHATARRIGAVVALFFTLGFMAGERWHQLVAWAMEHQLQGLARMGLPGGIPSELQVSPQLGVARVQRLELAPVRSAGNVAPPVRCRANAVVLLAATGLSQRAIARQLGISRRQVRQSLARA